METYGGNESGSGEVEARSPKRDDSSLEKLTISMEGYQPGTVSSLSPFSTPPRFAKGSHQFPFPTLVARLQGRRKKPHSGEPHVDRRRAGRGERTTRDTDLVPF